MLHQQQSQKSFLYFVPLFFFDPQDIGRFREEHSMDYSDLAVFHGITNNEVDAMSEDLEDVENYVFDEDDDDYDDEDDFEENQYEIVCPQCGEVVCVDEDMLDSDDLSCPNCGTRFEVDFSEDPCDTCVGCVDGADEDDEDEEDDE